MSNPRKATGTSAETAVVRLLTAHGIPAERRAPAGAADQGDIWALGGRAVIEVKSRRTPHTPADLERWLVELAREGQHALDTGAPVEIAVLVVKRVGSGAANVHQWHAVMRPDDAMFLLSGVSISDADGWVLMPLGMVADRLRGWL